MKELSIEEKARRYDEAIEIAKEINNEQQAQPFNVMTRVFPELKESEDERIRKSLINMLKNDEKCYLKEIDWLEKQADHAKFRNSIQVGDKVTRNEDGMLVNLSQLNRVAKKDEKQGEQKLADKVEPKFKVGDWITNNIDATFQIRSIEDNMYLRSDDYFIDIETADKKFRLWTIQDAKAGDVLSTDMVIFIFKENKEGSIFMHCNYSIVSNNFDISDTAEVNAECVHPATKEQRELLFTKMKKAGYEWDAEKKQLRKIEQKPADETPYPETLEKAIDLYYYSYGNGEGEFEHLSLEKFRDIVHTFVSDYGQKPAE